MSTVKHGGSLTPGSAEDIPLVPKKDQVSEQQAGCL
jgi:hypothetical protein